MSGCEDTDMGQGVRVTVRTASGQLIMESAGTGDRTIVDPLEFDIAIAKGIFAAHGKHFTEADREVMVRNYERRTRTAAKAA